MSNVRVEMIDVIPLQALYDVLARLPKEEKRARLGNNVLG